MEGVAANKDHNLTIISADIDKKTLPNMHYIHLEKMYDVIYDPNDNFDIIEYANAGPIKSVTGYGTWIVASCKGGSFWLVLHKNFSTVKILGLLASKGLKTILDYPDDFKFDVVVFDYTAGSCILPLIHKFKYPPLISVTPFSSPNFKTEYVGGHQYPAYSKWHF